MFDNEHDFEESLIALLQTKGWENEVLHSPSQKALVANWAQILFENNQGIDRLNGIPLTDGEMQQILEQITNLRTPLKLNGFINGKTVPITRDNPLDLLHLGKEISLKIYDRQEIAAGQSRYQIAQQVPLLRSEALSHDRRSDLMLLINGMPVIHIELKSSGIPVSQAAYQIEKYGQEGLFTGLFSLIQIFVAMNPDDAVYFANPGPDGQFNRDYYFHWADFYNEPINEWYRIATSLLSIPMAHQLIGFYTVADKTDGVLKVMRSYQYYAANAISVAVAKKDWSDQSQMGGYIWHTTGSGKTMTSFKSAQLIANSKDADKVVFLMDRIELGTQSLGEYRGFADESDDVQATENTRVLVVKLMSNDPANALIVTSIQKMSNIKEGDGAMNAHDIALMIKKRIVFIIDEAHRSTFGDMLCTIKATFPEALFFGFTGTPVHSENQKMWSTTATIFGDERHRYSIADGIRDKNVLGFDPYKVLTFKDMDVRRAIALEKAKAASDLEAIQDPKKSSVYYHYMDASKVKMAGYVDEKCEYIKGIEDELPISQYQTDDHRLMVVLDIKENWDRLSHGGKFHALLATSSILEAIAYYRLIKEKLPQLKVTALFDASYDNVDGAIYKGEGLIEILEDYNQCYQQAFDAGSHGRFKKDVSNRLAHKEPYRHIDKNPDQQLDLLIVVDQMLTGFDSKWLNTLYLDKLQKYEHIIQAFSRTNRLFGPEKPFGTIRYYRKPHTMERNVFDAVKLYSGDRPFGLFVQLLDANLKTMNDVYEDIFNLFRSAGIHDLERLPEEPAERGRFAKLFKQLNDHLEAAKVQGFRWDASTYFFEGKEGEPDSQVTVVFTQEDYLILAQRYKELNHGNGPNENQVPYDIDGYLTQIDTGIIDTNYMNSRFTKYLLELGRPGAQEALAELHKTFATLTQEEQKHANILIYDIQSGKAFFPEGMNFRDIITLYQTRAKNAQVESLVHAIGVDEILLRRLLNAGVTEVNINEFGRFDELKSTVDREKAKVYFEQNEGSELSRFQVNIRIQNILTEFVLQGGVAV